MTCRAIGSTRPLAVVLLFFILGLLCDRESSDYPDGTCDIHHFTCLKSYPPKAVLKKFDASTPYDCCKSCLSINDCQSWIHYYDNKTIGYQYCVSDYPQCILFDIDLNNNNSYPSTNLTSGNCVIGSPSKSNEKKPNFVLYYPDTIRAEYMSVYGYPLDTTPNIAKFADKYGGIIFDNHIAQHSQCSPSRCAMLTGRYMHTTAKRTLTSLIQTWEPNYLRWLKDSGYYVLWVGKNDALSQDSFPLSVNEWHHSNGIKSGKQVYPYPQRGFYSMLNDASDVYGNNTVNGDYKGITIVEQFLANNPPQPFVIFIPGFGAHPPYSAPIDYYSMYDTDWIQRNYPLRPPYIANKPNYFSPTEGIPFWHNLTGFNDSLFYKINSIYLGRVSYTDWIFGQLVTAIESFHNSQNRSNSRDMLVWMSSDHGDYSGDHRFVEKWPGGMDDQLIWIPLITAHLKAFKDKNWNSNNEATHLKSVTMSFDVLETMLDFANVKRTFNAFGLSLRNQILDKTELDLNRYGFSEGGLYYYNELYPNGSDHITRQSSVYWAKNAEEMQNNGNGCPRVVSMQNLEYKIVFRSNGFVSELYDLVNDKKQMNNLWWSDDSNIQIIKSQMLFNLTQWFVNTADVTPILMDTRAMPTDFTP